MFHTYDMQRPASDQPIAITPVSDQDIADLLEELRFAEYSEDDIDTVDDALLNTSPHNVIEKQLLRGDVIGLALMSGAILWSAMGAFG
jgi:hypothetical protein